MTTGKTALASVAVVMLLAATAVAEEKLGLLIIAHGSPSPAWNQPVLDVEREVSEIMRASHPGMFRSVRVALMEFVEPSIATVVSEMEDEGVTRIYALPLLIAPSGHSLYDIPTILGLYSDTEMVAQMEDEGIRIVDTGTRITLGPTLGAGVIKPIALDRVREMSMDPDSEAIVILAHGDRRFEPIWASLATEVGADLCANAGMAFFDYAFVGMGQGFMSEGIPAIFRALEKKNRVLVVGLYMSAGIDRMAQKAMARMRDTSATDREIFAGRDVRFADQGLLPDRRISEWIVEMASAWAEGLSTQ